MDDHTIHSRKRPVSMAINHTRGLSVRGRGFTMVELMLSLTITAIIGAAVAAMLASVSYATTDRADLRRVNTKQNVVAARLNACLRSCKMVLAIDADSLVLWMGDSRLNNSPDLSELRRLEWDTATGELWSYVAPSNLADASNTSYRLTDDFESITFALMGTSDFPGRLWATNVAGWTNALDDATPQHASLVTYTLAVSGEDLTSTGTYTISFRSR